MPKKHDRIEPGEFRRDGTGKKIGPMVPNPFDHDGSYPWTAENSPYSYTDNGVWMNGQKSEHDLVLGKGA